MVFAAEASWAGRLEPLGFVEDLVDLAPPPPPDAPEQAAGQFWTDFIRETKPVFRTSTFDQLTGFMQPTWQALIDGAMYCEPQLKEIIERQRPDVIIEDNVNCFPALTTAGVPFVRIVSCQPLEMKGPDIPPTYSGLPADDRSEWEAFRAEYDRTHRPMWQALQRVGAVVRRGAAWPISSSSTRAIALNLYTYPEVIDYTDRRPLGADLASPRLVGACDRRAVRGAARTRARRRRVDLPVARFARFGRRRADATPHRRARPHAAPLHRVEGPVARHVRPARRTCGALSRCPRPTCCRRSIW